MIPQFRNEGRQDRVPYLRRLRARGDVNLYSLFVERAFALLKPESVVGLLTPSGIASTMSATEPARCAFYLPILVG